MSKFTFRSGKHKGKTLDWVEDNDPSYLSWVEEFRPEMLKEPSEKEEKIKEYRPKPLEPNYNFDNEVTHHPTKNENKDKNEDEPEWNF